MDGRRSEGHREFGAEDDKLSRAKARRGVGHRILTPQPCGGIEQDVPVMKGGFLPNTGARLLESVSGTEWCNPAPAR
jgi:hypothetical protein